MQKPVLPIPTHSAADWLRPALIAGAAAAAMVAGGALHWLLGLVLSTFYWLPLFLVGFRFGTAACAVAAGFGTIAAFAAGALLGEGAAFGFLFIAAIALPATGLTWLFHRRDAFGLPWSPQKIAGIVIIAVLAATAGGVGLARTVLQPAETIDRAFDETGITATPAPNVDCSVVLSDLAPITRRGLFNFFLASNLMRQELTDTPDEGAACLDAWAQQDFINAFVQLMQFVGAALIIGFAVGLMVANAGLAQVMLEKRRLLPRPAVHPQLIALPWWFGAATGLAILCAFALPGIIAPSSAAYVLVLNLLTMILMIHATAGLWTVHAAAPRRQPWRVLFLLVSYVVIVFTIAALAMLIGILDQLLGIRQRIIRRRATPSTP